MKYLFLAVAILLMSCGGGGGKKEFTPVVNAPPEISTEYVDQSVFWCIPQYYGGNVPKYCAAGTYTHKHIPLAYWANDTLYHVYTDNTKDDNFYIYAAKGNTEKVLIHTIENWNDPHTNAVIHVRDDGHVCVHVASRGLAHKFQSGKVLVSKTPYELDFECVDGCDNINVEAYPQVWNTKWGEHIGYTQYIIYPEIHPTMNFRTLWYRVGGVKTQLVKGGHYSVSSYKDGALYLAYNQLVDGKPDNRINLYMIKTIDGVNWTNLEGRTLSLPLSTHDIDALIYESDGYVYLKDIEGSSILFTESTDYDPTIGVRSLKEWRNGMVTTISETNHNYNGGAYFGEYILSTQDGAAGWTGGDLVLYRDYKEVSRNSDSNCNYPRKAINSSTVGVVSCGPSNVEESGQHMILELN